MFMLAKIKSCYLISYGNRRETITKLQRVFQIYQLPGNKAMLQLHWSLMISGLHTIQVTTFEDVLCQTTGCDYVQFFLRHGRYFCNCYLINLVNLIYCLFILNLNTNRNQGFKAFVVLLRLNATYKTEFTFCCPDDH